LTPRNSSRLFSVKGRKREFKNENPATVPSHNNRNHFNAPRRFNNKKKITFVKDMVTEGTENYVDLQCLGNET